jgi:hypothetical protein
MEPSITGAQKSSSVRSAGIGSLFGTYDRWLIALFLFSLPFVNPWVHGDGVGYYAFVRSLVIEHRLDFRQDWLHANPEFRMSRTDAQGRITAGNYTSTGHLNNHFAIGPALLWLPFLLAAHAGVLISNALGSRIPPDGFSKPYVVVMAVSTALYGFLALWISYRIARRYVAERWAFLATLAFWGASSLPVYMYFNPSWSHAQSAFVVALFLWYWNRTRGARAQLQWIFLGLIGGLMMDVYYVNAIVLVLPLFESLARCRQSLSLRRPREAASLLAGNVCFSCALLIAFLPTLIAKKIIYGSYLNFGYTERWSWNSPALLKVAFSSDHGLFSWTPIVILAVAGLFLLLKRDRDLALYCLVAFALFLYVIGSYQDWDGLSSFGNRFFVSLTPMFILGLAVLFDWLALAWNPRRALGLAAASMALLILWNFGMMYQWGMHLVPVRGPISWRDAAYNQVAVVPVQAARTFENYILRRSQLMRHIENEDIEQLRSHPK